MTDSTSQGVNYRPDIDGLRALAVLFVILYHYFPNILKSGFIGVDIFFVISGYLISGILIRQSEGKDIDFINFYCRRIRRIFPALICTLILVLVIGYLILHVSEIKRLGKYILGGGFFSTNFILYLEHGYFDVQSKEKVLLHLWSLAIEEQFYLFFPILLHLLNKRKDKRFLILVIIFCLSFSLNFVSNDIAPEYNFYSPLTRFWELFAGVLLYLFASTQQKDLSVKFYNKTIFLNLYSILGAIFLILSAHFFSEQEWPGLGGLLPIIGTSLIIYSGQISFLNKKILSNKIIVYIGLVSYPLYLWHWPFISFLNLIIRSQHVYFNGFSIIYIKIVLIVISFILAVLTFHFVEKPIRFNTDHKKYALKLIFVMLFTCLLGLTVYCKPAIFRFNSGNYEAILYQLNTFSETNQEAYKYIGEETCKKLDYCIFSGTNYNKTLAIIGDSHALAAYHGFEQNGGIYKYNTLLLNWYVPSSEDREPAKAYQNQIILDIILAKNDISIVLIINRGHLYLHSNDNTRPNRKIPIAYDKYKISLQNTVDLLTNNGKKVYLLTNNPELPFGARILPGAPIINITKNIYWLDKNSLTEHHSIYNKLLSEINNATIIDVVPIFCPKDICQALTDTKLPFYTDDDHLSYEGSKFQANGIFKNNLIDLSYLK